jgi:trans-aconitate 2-methyltransferase
LSAWSPEQYERFKSERAQPFWDLAALIEHRPKMRIVDLGCGTGELTRALHDHLHAEETLGIDSSETMLLKSSAFGHELLRFEKGTIESFVADRPFDLVFSNAALHWVADHSSLLRRLTSFVGREGQIAIQMPANDDHPSHRTAAEVARELSISPRPPHVMAPEEYATLLFELGYKRQHVRMQVYGHVLPSSADVVEWVRGSLLTFYERDDPRFLDRYRERLMCILGDQRPYFYTYRRVLMWASF